MEKMCSKCRRIKAFSDFPRSRSTRTGFHAYCRECVSEENRKRRAAQDPEVQRDYQRRMQLRIYGLLPEDYDRILAEQGGRCGLCDTPDPGGGKHFAVDHDHETGRVRGLLCTTCNVRVGVLELYLSDPVMCDRVNRWLASDADGRSIRSLFDSDVANG